MRLDTAELSYNVYRRRLTGNSDKNLRIVVRSRGFRRIAVADGRSLA